MFQTVYTLFSKIWNFYENVADFFGIMVGMLFVGILVVVWALVLAVACVGLSVLAAVLLSTAVGITNVNVQILLTLLIVPLVIALLRRF